MMSDELVRRILSALESADESFVLTSRLLEIDPMFLETTPFQYEHRYCWGIHGFWSFAKVLLFDDRSILPVLFCGFYDERSEEDDAESVELEAVGRSVKYPPYFFVRIIPL